MMMYNWMITIMLNLRNTRNWW